MKIYNKNLCVFAMSSFLLMACDQAADNQLTDVSVSQVNTGVTISKSGSTVALSNDNISVYKGDTFTLDIVMDEFITSEGGGVTLRFDGDLVQVVNVTVDSSVWQFKNKEGFVNNAEGKVSNILFSSYQGVEGSAKIATVEFKSIERGVSVISLEESAANTFASGGEKVAVVFKTTTVSSN